MANFYPRSPCGERLVVDGHRVHITRFLSTLSLRRATIILRYSVSLSVFSIHALLAESDWCISRKQGGSTAFLSTLSLRRATPQGCFCYLDNIVFYPRSPCGERRIGLVFLWWGVRISIHALLAESDGIQAETAVFVPPISIHALLAESDRGAYRGARQSRPISIHALLAESDKNTSIAGRITEISIHALLAESDNQCKIDQKRSSNFYPRSPCGERQV